MVSVCDAHDVELQPALLHEFLLLAADLLQEASADGPDAADKEVEHLIFREEERVVNHVERLAQRFAVDHKGDVRLGGSLCAGDDVDAVPPQRAEEFSGDARRLLHVLADDGNGCEVIGRLDGVDFAHFNLLGELFVEHLAGEGGILVPHTDGGTVFRRSL